VKQKPNVAALVAAWAALTAAGVSVALSVGLLPSPASAEAHIIDGAMTLLTVLAVPVFSLVVVLLIYSVLQFRQRGEPGEDGPPIRGNLKLEVTWVLVTLALVLVLAGYGTAGLLDIRAHAARQEGELVVQVRGYQWFWIYTYPAYGIQTKEELRLPVGRPVRFEITAADVLHSFWVPSFRTKIDAVPGMTTVVYATPDRTGSFQEDYQFRVQCAELCGLDHGVMTTPVVVVEPSQFEAWAAEQSIRTR